MTHHVVMFSGGLGSWLTARRAVAQASPGDSLFMLFADVKGNSTSPHVGEDEDAYRFIEEAASNVVIYGADRDVEAELVTVMDGRDIWQVFKDDRFLGNSRLANCSKFLKQKPCRDWLDANCDPADTTVYVGIDWTETHRLPAIEAGWAPYPVKAPMTEAPFLDKSKMQTECLRAGIALPRLYRAGFPHNNCLHPDTRYITSDGIKTLRETLGKTVRVLGRGGGWREATIQSFGEQATYKLTLSRYGDRKVVTTTADHLWPVRSRARGTAHKFKTTSELLAGDRIAGMYGAVRPNVTPSATGVAAGFTFGDGSAPAPSSGQVVPAAAYLCGEKDQALLPYFLSCRKSVRPDGVVVVHDLPRAWKQAPSLAESQSYLYGWLVGYLAADGTVSGGQVKLSSSRAENLAVVRDVCARIGVAAGRIQSTMRRGYGIEETPLYTLALVPGTLRPDAFVIPAHRERFEATKRTRPADWRVVCREATGFVEEVMCPVVPDGHVFTLDDNVLTHNCGGFCVRAGQAQMELLLREHPERYAYAEDREQELREHLDADVSVLRDRSGGTSTPLTLRSFRERLEDQPNLFDPLDFGGCGCFTESGGAA